MTISLLKATTFKEIVNSNRLVAIKLQSVRTRIGFSRMIHKVNLKIRKSKDNLVALTLIKQKEDLLMDLVQLSNMLLEIQTTMIYSQFTIV